MSKHPNVPISLDAARARNASKGRSAARPTSQPAPAQQQLVFHMGPEQFREILRYELEDIAGMHASFKILNRKEAAEFLGCDEKTVLKLIKEDGFPGAKVGREWRFQLLDIVQWLRHRMTDEQLAREFGEKE